jgi:methionyl-tRNA formyltransferase
VRVLFYGTPDFAVPSLRALLGDGVAVERWRPVGRSGRVTTPTTSKPSPSRARSDGTAKSGVP